jgi:hypothetical protein
LGMASPQMWTNWMCVRLQRTKQNARIEQERPEWSLLSNAGLFRLV